MDVFKAIISRRSIRKYRFSSIPENHLKKILEAARLAPSAGNRQPWKFLIVRNPKTKKLLAEVARKQMFLADAGAIIVAMGDSKASPGWYEKDTMIAVEHMVLASTALGYGTCWIGAFTEEEVKKIFKIDNGMKVVALLSIGVPDENPDSKPRKLFSEVFHSEKYGTPLEL